MEMAGGAERTGTIRLVSPEMNAASRLGRIRIAIDPRSDGWHGLVLGGFGRAVIRTARHTGVLVALSAVQFGADGAHVQVVRNGVVETRTVRLGLRAEGRAEIMEGLAAGEAVVAVSGTFVRGGDHVTAIPAAGL
jgi:hypothetical protein